MATLSRHSSPQPLLSEESSTSLTSFPDYSQTSLSPENQHSKRPLHGLLDGDGPSMFDENKSLDAMDPQTLSTAPADTLRGIIEHHGAVELVRRLSKLLAERDAHITSLKRLSEEYNIPKNRVDEAASRIKQTERRRLSLASASEDFGPSSEVGSDNSGSVTPASVSIIGSAGGGAMKGLTRLFGGGAVTKPTVFPTSPIATSTARRRTDRAGSMDAQSIQSVRSNDSVKLTSAMGNLFGGSAPKHQDSRVAREPVEMKTRHDKEQLPPTLSSNLKDPQEAEWNAFLMRLMKSHQQNGEDTGGGEMIGASRFGREGQAGQMKLQILTRLVLNGVPMHMRHPIWMELSNTNAIMQPDLYTHYLSLRDDEDPEIDAIVNDVPRTLTSKFEFFPGKGFKRLKEVLIAFVGRYKDLGYTQGLNTIAGYLLLTIPSESDAFWVLCNTVENFFPPNYFSRENALTAPLADNTVLRSYLKNLKPDLHKHLDDLGILPTHTVPLSWFLTAFSSVVPDKVLMRIWDVWLCLPNQKHFVFNVALTLLHHNNDGIMGCGSASEYFSYMDNELRIPVDSERITEFIVQAFGERKNLADVEERRSKEMWEVSRAMWKLKRSPSLEALKDMRLEEDGGDQYQS